MREGIDSMTAIKYIHHTPGRLRVKGRHFNCHGARARKAVAELQALPGVERVQLNAHAGSLTVQYDPEMCSQGELLAVLDAAGCLNVAADIDAASATGRPARARRHGGCVRQGAGRCVGAAHCQPPDRRAPLICGCKTCPARRFFP